MKYITKTKFHRRANKLWFNILTEDDAANNFYTSIIEIDLNTKEVNINYTMLNNKSDIELIGRDKEFIINKAYEIAKDAKYI